MFPSASTRFLGSAILSLVMLLGAGVALAAEPPASGSAQSTMPSKAMREKMAAMHEQMASCLRSDKSMSECRSEMMKRCRSMMGESCPMMGKMGMGGMGMGMGGGMQDHKCPGSDNGTGTRKPG